MASKPKIRGWETPDVPLRKRCSPERTWRPRTRPWPIFFNLQVICRTLSTESTTCRTCKRRESRRNSWTMFSSLESTKGSLVRRLSSWSLRSLNLKRKSKS